METGCIAQSHLRALTYLPELMPLRYEPPQDKDQEQEQRRSPSRVAHRYLESISIITV
jgi:hypothetical protein